MSAQFEKRKVDNECRVFNKTWIGKVWTSLQEVGNDDWKTFWEKLWREWMKELSILEFEVASIP